MHAWLKRTLAGCCRHSAAGAATLLLIAILTAAAAAPFRLDKDIVADEAVLNAAQLAKQADRVAVGRFTDSLQGVGTDRLAPQGRLVNYVQTFKVERMLKGPARETVEIVTTGIEPLPPTSQIEANVRYPGPWAPGPDYLLFLKKLEGRDSYQVLGLLKGVYPIQAGRTVRLKNHGFPELHQVPKVDLPSVVQGLESR
jgi:hypothetical protein